MPFTGEPKLPAGLQGALHSLYDNYRQSFGRWQANTDAQARGLTPPVFVVVCNNTNVSKMVFDYVAGWAKPVADDAEVVVPGALSLFSNEENGRWSARPNTILVDSQQLESEEGMSPEFKKIAAAEIEEFKADYRARFPGRSTDDLRDEDLLREVMNTVGKAGKLGERVRCVVSVSMLTEGWDANTVTHILGVRAFGTQLLCEQVVGRGLRRMSCTACRSRSSHVPDQIPTRGRVRCRRVCGHSRIASRARSPSRGCSATDTTFRANGCRQGSRTTRSSPSRQLTSRPERRTRRSSASAAFTRWTI